MRKAAKMEMMTVYDFLNACEACDIDTTKLRAAVYIAERTDPKTMKFSLSYDDIAKAIGISYSAAAKFMKQMQKAGLIKSVSRGVWMWATPIFEPVRDLEQASDEIDVCFKNYCVG